MVDLLQDTPAVIHKITLIIWDKCVLDFLDYFELGSGLLDRFYGYIWRD